MDKKLKIGVIGTGHMGSNHVRILFEEKKFFDLVGIYDSSKEKAGHIANSYNIRAFDTIDKLLDNVDAVTVAVPSSLHYEIGLMVAEKGVHALIEKPIAPTVDEAQKLVTAFEKRSLKLAIGHVERFNSVIVELKKLVKSDKIFYIEAHRYSPFSGSGRIQDVSVIDDLMIHDIDLIMEIMSPYTVTDIRGNGERIRSNSIDFATAMLNFEERAHAVINASRVSQNKERTLCIHTEDSTITADLLTKMLVIRQNTNIDIDAPNGNILKQSGLIKEIYVPIKEPLREEMIAFYKSIALAVPVAVTGQMGLHAVEVSNKVADRIINQMV